MLDPLLPFVAASAGVETGTTVLFGTLLVAMIAALALEEKLHAKKSVIVAVFAVVALVLGEIYGLIHRDTVTILGHDITFPVYVPGVDWAVIAIIVGSSLFVDLTSRSGLFTWVAVKLTKASRGDPRRLLYLYGLMTVVFSALLNNVTAMIIVGSLTGVSLKKLDRTDKLLGFLLVEGLLTNIGGLLTLVSSVPNIIVGNTAEISFMTFVVKAAPFVVVATWVTLWMGARKFEIHALEDGEERTMAAERVAEFDENDGIESKFFFNFGATMLGLFILTIAAASVPGWFLNDLGMGFVALMFATIMLVRFKSTADRYYQELDWDLIAFFGSLFVVIHVMEHAGVLTAIGGLLEPITQLDDTLGSSLMLLGSAVFSSVTDNIPLAAMLAKILDQLGTPQDSQLWWSVIFGSNLGGNLTPIGSASTLVAVTIMHRNKLQIGFASFVKLAITFAIVQLVLATGYIALFTLL